MGLLKELVVENVALIDRVQVPFGPGFNVLTGETGAGKSLILDALGLAVGQRASADLVRTGEEVARVDAVFELPDGHPVAAQLAAWGYEGDDGLWVLSREVTRSGRGRARVNGRPVTTGELARVGELLVSIHTQHESQRLLRPAVQLDLLDGFAGSEVMRLRQEVERLYREWKQVEEELAGLVDGERRRLQEMDLLRFQIEEIAAARLSEGEPESLGSEYRRLANASRLQQLLFSALEHLAGGSDAPSAADRLGAAAALLAQAGGLDPEAGELSRRLEGLASQVSDLARAVRHLAERCEPDPARLEQVQARLALIDRLQRKYGATVQEVLAYLGRARQRLAELESASHRAEELHARRRELEDAYGRLAAVLSERRRQAASTLAEAVRAEAAALAMPRVRVEILVEAGEVGPAGRDRVEFRLSANPDEPPRPLARIASGGELSRTMLACRTVLAEADPVPVLVFDEPDAGVGGRAAQAVGERLARLGRVRQVLVVTHLPQVASLADRHLAVGKVEQQGRSRIRVELLDVGRRVEELARMLGGAEVTETARRHAEELLRLAGQARPAG